MFIHVSFTIIVTSAAKAIQFEVTAKLKLEKLPETELSGWMGI